MSYGLATAICKLIYCWTRKFSLARSLYRTCPRIDILCENACPARDSLAGHADTRESQKREGVMAFHECAGMGLPFAPDVLSPAQRRLQDASCPRIFQGHPARSGPGSPRPEPAPCLLAMSAGHLKVSAQPGGGPHTGYAVRRPQDLGGKVQQTASGDARSTSLVTPHSGVAGQKFPAIPQFSRKARLN